MGPPPATDRLRVGTYNIRYSSLDTGPRAWPRRRDGVAGHLGQPVHGRVQP